MARLLKNFQTGDLCNRIRMLNRNLRVLNILVVQGDFKSAGYQKRYEKIAVMIPSNRSYEMINRSN